ncbi:HAD-IA family hydrolase [[Clostridium] aminophilum]|uniref:Haloacid dehalogenase superfamily, subfamily IA, variant 1 with third motif having Dx(3-4)D or Dx(3-4)E n=2 Tax=[Clostridium] aminophilum TaxID=1526 RepID=A0A1I6K5P8_9FIRM|nr:HAD-IA family hydrolase [[Clostridium] aminophilum]SFR86585.1 haloacid dehalogenase superfamily, subfamily IA, variant 1 with third motif having Dx(3-4)D or Dx(3-4)E [[Clostridium] aminophilum]
MHILFTGVGRRIELLQAFRNAALVLNKELKIYGADLAGTAPALAYCDFSRRVVAMRDFSYIQNLLDICATDHIDLLIPTIDTDLLVLSENKEKFEAIGTKVLISNPDKIRICRDKNNTSQFFVDCGLHAPMPVNNWKEYKSGYPAFIKPKDGSSSINAFKVENREELEVYARQVEDYIVQPFVSGHEYTIDIFCDWLGEPISIVPRERLQVRAGEVLKTRICMDRQMIEESKALCKAFKPCGPMTVQLIRDADGIDWFIEINPRFGGGAPLSMKAGARSAEAILKLMDGEEVKEQEIADGAIYSRFDQSVCITEGKGRIKGVIFDLDDTLYSEKEYVKSGYKAVSDYLGGDYEVKLWSFFEAGKPAIDELLKELGRETVKEEILQIYRAHKPKIHLYPGVVEMIENLKAKGIKVGIITDGRPEGQRNKLDALGVEVDDVIITDELGGVQFRKPCDIAFRIMATRWRLNPADIVYVGDNLTKDFQAPQQLGMKQIWYRNRNGLHSTDLKSNENIMCVEAFEDIDWSSV